MNSFSKLDYSIYLLFTVFSIFVFRIREYGSETVDFQILFRLMSWGGSFLFAFYVFSRNAIELNRHEKLLVLFFVLGFLLLPFSIAPARSFINLLSYIAFYLMLKSLDTRLGTFGMLKVVLYSFAFCTICSIVYYYLIPTLGRHIYWLSGMLYVSPRMSGVFSTSNAMGGFSAVYLILLYYSRQVGILENKWLLIMVTISSFCLLKSDSKTALVSLLIAIFFIAPNTKYKAVIISLILYVISMVVVFLCLEPDTLLRAISRHGDPNEVLTFTGRTHIWPAVISKIIDNPLVGYGIGVTSIALPELSYIIGYTPAHAHNLVLQATFSMGVIGGGLSILIVLYNFFVVDNDRLAVGLSVYVLVTSLLESSFLNGIAGYSIIPFILMCMVKKSKKVLL
ncbi:O-antigen ligase family protein [Vibrio sp. SCSIO 43136]|uniref:O-antigen ligase family protein n=1 Tax=Vibrio sp. SCSIO 43136 TaxID=2819101 RepID=UPI002075EF0D|nr:O-antigen ligase family protein [Vibrio sp. SCSIO 43136]USD67034.1 O-antigen ligase family protein [Vibrio sp. SCSIO 43136]